LVLILGFQSTTTIGLLKFARELTEIEVEGLRSLEAPRTTEIARYVGNDNLEDVKFGEATLPADAVDPSIRCINSHRDPHA
jgi:hypothetical protein